MSDKPSAISNVFIVYPENHKLVSGEISFTERSRQLRRNAFILVTFAFVTSAALWLIFSRSGTSLTCSAFFVILLPALAFLESGLPKLYAARLHRQLERGTFRDGQIVSSELAWASHGRGYGLRLKAMYRFQTPNGEYLQHTAIAWRYDLWEQARTRFKGIRGVNASKEDKKRLQEFAPPPGTPVKVRYVNDSLFRVM